MSIDFSAKLKAWRGKLTQREAAQLLGVPLRSVENWEQGTSAPRPVAMSEIERRMAETNKEPAK